MIRIVILGTGNVAKHLFDAFSRTKTVKVVQVVGRNQERLKNFSDTTADFSDIANADAYIISVSDSAISSVAQSLIKKKGLILHTSGSVSLEGLSPNKNTGVFYPLQTFSIDRDVHFESVPICIETSSEQYLNFLEDLGKSISEKVYKIDSAQRRVLHLAAVFANNFTNHMYHMANEICEEHKLPFDILKPLIQETAQKVQSNPPDTMQTGPARRNDSETIQKHLMQLRNEKQREIYTLLSQSIKEIYGEKL